MHFFSVCGTVIWFLRFTTNLLKCSRSYGDCNFFRLFKINVGLNALMVMAKQRVGQFKKNVDFFVIMQWLNYKQCLTKILVPLSPWSFRLNKMVLYTSLPLPLAIENDQTGFVLIIQCESSNSSWKTRWYRITENI